jgi:hypothetical protein
MEIGSQDLTWRDYLGPVIARRCVLIAIGFAAAAAENPRLAQKPGVDPAPLTLRDSATDAARPSRE